MTLYLSFLSIGLAGVLLFFNWKVNRNALFLTLMMVLIATGQVRHHLILHATDPYLLSFFINSPSPLWSMTGPCLFFYVRSVLTDRVAFRKSDLLHTLPFWVSLVGTLPYLLTPFSYKIEVANLFIHNMAAASEVRFNWLLGNETNLLSRYALQIGYSLACLWMILVFQSRRRKASRGISLQGGVIIKWLVGVSVFVLLVGVYYFVGVYVYFRNPAIERDIVTIHNVLYFNGVALTFFPAMVLAFPEILYGIPRRREALPISLAPYFVEPATPAENVAPTSTSGVVETVPQASAMGDAAEVDPMQELRQRVLDFMELEKPYLSRDFSIEDLADMLEVPRHHMYYCFKHVFKTRFVILRSEFRVREAQRKLLEVDLGQTTLYAIGTACGFASHSAFYRIFREMAGCSPGEFVEREKGRDAPSA